MKKRRDSGRQLVLLVLIRITVLCYELIQCLISDEQPEAAHEERDFGGGEVGCILPHGSCRACLE
ncbi:MAG TPA: hypothetical protein VGV59_10110 [Pyrinomonadaceae bacterium]|nr:hypothetical protein [Pyrinomonadaceae bacterium]